MSVHYRSHQHARAHLIVDNHHVISSILRHDQKQNSYKIALLRSLGDAALSFPGFEAADRPVAVPLRVLADYWIAYFWPFADEERPILQGPRQTLGDSQRQDVAFRADLTALRREWKRLGGSDMPSDGFLLIHELRVPRRRKTYSPDLLRAYMATVRKIQIAIQQPIKYAGPGHWEVFDRPKRLLELGTAVTALPSARENDLCVTVSPSLWRTLQELSLWVEALCIHEWCLFTESVRQPAGQAAGRGTIYTLLTDRPDNRRPLTWERNQIDILIMEGQRFVCPWTEKRITHPDAYDLDHLLPVSVYPANELWNLVPADRTFNQHVKRGRLPSWEGLRSAEPIIASSYAVYFESPELQKAIGEDVRVRFRDLAVDPLLPADIADAACRFIHLVAGSRNIARF